MKRKLFCVLAALLIFGLFIGCEGKKPQEAAANGKYRIALSNAYMGNDWRQVMLKTAEVIAQKEPYRSKVELTIVNCENSPEAQSASIDVLVEQGYDAIIVDASSPTGLNPALHRAQNAGIVVVVFDNVVIDPNIHIVHLDETANGTGWATFIAKQLKPGDEVAVDIGLSGTTVGDDIYNAAVKVFNDAGIRVVAEFESQWSDGVGQQQIASVLAANPGLDGLLCQAFGETIEAAFIQAGRPFIPSSCNLTNAGQLAALNRNMNVVSSIDPPGLSALAMDIALRILEGEEVAMDIAVPPQFFTVPDKTNVDIGAPYTTIEKGVTCFENMPGALPWPVITQGFPVPVTIDEISAYQR
jgi:ribose transport system substrate-binding protein